MIKCLKSKLNKRVVSLVMAFMISLSSFYVSKPIPVLANPAALPAIFEGWELILSGLAALGFFGSSESASFVEGSFIDYCVDYANGLNVKDSEIYTEIVNQGFSEDQAYELSKRAYGFVCLWIYGMKGKINVSDIDSWSSLEGVVFTDSTNKTISYHDSYDGCGIIVTYPELTTDIKTLQASEKWSIQVGDSSQSLDNFPKIDKSVVNSLLAFLLTFMMNYYKNSTDDGNSYSSSSSIVSPDYASNSGISYAYNIVKMSSSKNFMENDSTYVRLYNLSLNSLPLGTISDGYSSDSYFENYTGIYLIDISHSPYFFFSENLTGYRVYYDSYNFYKVDSNGSTSGIYFMNYGGGTFDSWKSATSNYSKFMQLSVNPFRDCVNTSDNKYIQTYTSVPSDKLFSSLDNLSNDINLDSEKESSKVFGPDSLSLPSLNTLLINPELFVSDEDIPEGTSLADYYASLLAAYQSALAQAIENNNSNTETSNSLLQVVQTIDTRLNAWFTGVPAILQTIINGITSTNDYLTKVPLLLDAVRNIEEGWTAADEALSPIGLLTDLDDNVADLAHDVGVINGALEGLDGTVAGAISTALPIVNTEAGAPAVAVTVVPTAPSVNDGDGFNSGFFALFALLLIILYKIFMIFYHCLALLATLHGVQASPYFLNADMIAGFNWLKQFIITGPLLGISAYDFMWALVRILLIFSIIRLIRVRVEKFKL